MRLVRGRKPRAEPKVSPVLAQSGVELARGLEGRPRPLEAFRSGGLSEEDQGDA